MLNNVQSIPQISGGGFKSITSGGGFTLLSASENLKGMWIVTANLNVDSAGEAWLCIHTQQPTGSANAGRPILMGTSNGPVVIEKISAPIYVGPGLGIYGYSGTTAGKASANWALLT